MRLTLSRRFVKIVCSSLRGEADIIKFKDVDYEALNDTYKELIKVIGNEAAEKRYDHYRGTVLNFPVRVYSSDYIKKFVTENPNSEDIKKLSINLGCSERWVRKLARDGDGGDSTLC